MDKNCVVMTYVMLELTDRLKERLAFDVTNRTTYFYDGNLSIFASVIAVETALYLICDMLRTDQ